MPVILPNRPRLADAGPPDTPNESDTPPRTAANTTPATRRSMRYDRMEGSVPC